MIWNSAQSTTNRRPAASWLWLGPLIYMLLVGLYAVARYGGRWAEADSATFTKIIAVFAEAGRLVPEGGTIYPNGYAFQAVSTFLIGATGLDIATLQQLAYPLVAALLVLPAWALYRELTGTARAATLASVLLFMQPEFLFVILRSSHEKFTRALLLTCLFLLARTLRMRERPWQLAAHAGLFYLTTFALIASNNLLANSFIFAVFCMLVLGFLLQLRTRGASAERRYALWWFGAVTAVGAGMVYLFTNYIYPPAQHNVLILGDIWERIAALLLDVQSTGGHGATNAYAQVETSWVNLYVYFIVSIANWIILAVSCAIWTYQGLRWLIRGRSPSTDGGWLLWLLYAAFALQGALSVVADASGALASNLQHRLFPSFSIVAAALVGASLARWSPRRYPRAARLAISTLVFCVAILSVLKATNEPLLSNMWTFYRADEIRALQWGEAHSGHLEVCADFNERLTAAYETTLAGSTDTNRVVWYASSPSRCNVLVTDVTRLRAQRLDRPLPVGPDALQVYDNGRAQLYRPRPETPFQR